MDREAPHLLKVPDGAIASFYILDTTGSVANMPADHLLKPHLAGFESFPKVPSWAFLIESHCSGTVRRVIFDLSFPQDIDSLPPVISDRLRASNFVFNVPKNTAEVLLEHAGTLARTRQDKKPLRLTDIEAVVWSHWHADHQGDIQQFPESTDLIVGPGFCDSFLPAYPDNLASPIRKQDLSGRKLREVTFDGPESLRIGQFKALDFFGNGSFYLLDTPGHAIGHIGGLVRTSTLPDTFAFLGGDLSHHGGELRPSKHLSLLAAAAAVGEREPENEAAAFAALEEIQKNRDRGIDQVFFDPRITWDFDVALQTIARVQDAEAQDNVFFLGAHDDTLQGVVDVFPLPANAWKAKGWKEKCMWTFIRDFHRALSPKDAFQRPYRGCCGS